MKKLSRLKSKALAGSYEKLTGKRMSFIQYLKSGPSFENIKLERDASLMRDGLASRTSSDDSGCFTLRTHRRHGYQPVGF